MINSPSERRQRTASAGPAIDRLPPNSAEAERGVLGCAMLDPQCVAGLDLADDAFYGLQHRTIWKAMRRLLEKYQTFDAITLSAYLKKKGLLDQCGGDLAIGALADGVPSAFNLPNYVGILRDKHDRRKMVETCTRVASLAQSDTHLDELKFIVQTDLADVFGIESRALGTSAKWQDLVNFNTENDVNNVIGVVNGKTTRYLCRGHSAWLIGPSGVGKSSLLMLIGISFAAGLPFCGITPQRALRVLVVQAENDDGDMSEMAKGIRKGLKLEESFGEQDLVEQNLLVRSVTGKIGQAWCSWLRQEIVDHRADLVLADPLLSFAGIDVSRQDQASQFCRVWLDPVLRETGTVLLSAHHTGKPPRRDGKEQPATLHELAYSGIGSSELVNWARAIMFLQPVGDGAFKLVLAKRGKRAGARHPNLEPTTTLWLRHATDGSIFWEQVDPPEEAETAGEPRRKKTKLEQVMECGLGKVIDALTEPTGTRELARRIVAHAVVALGITVSKTTACTAIAQLEHNKAIKRDNNDKFTKA